MKLNNLVILVCITCVKGFVSQKNTDAQDVFGDFGKPAFLTTYIENHDIEGARRASAVPPFLEDVESYAGFFTVNKTYNSNIYFWFFPAREDKENAPVVVWLQGGPGASSLYGLFIENGVYCINQTGSLELRTVYWSKIANVIYIDNPVGTGFSFTDSEQGYATEQAGIGKDLYNMIDQFFLVFPEYRKNNFYIFGESYGGKYAPSMAYAIHTNNLISDRKIKLKGIGIGNGFTDPPNMMLYDEYLYNIGLIDEKGKNIYKQHQNLILDAYKNGLYEKAGIQFWNMTKCVFYNETGFTFSFNFLHYKDDLMNGDIGKFLSQKYVRRGLHVGDIPFLFNNTVVIQYLLADTLQSVVPWLETLLENYRVLVYSGQLDIICAYPLTVNYLKKLEWSGAQEYKNAKREKWFVDGELAGYVKQAKGLTEVLVRNSGHMVPQDQPTRALILLKKFIFNQPF
ncbi:venom serine carboxypeptidase-like [Cimex lectularius]|uniref:Carboxypeptidase n=1 Tax=Cimex lectularius TaxID=79782 RepID=A0A8I6RZ05_CIMLE|nr:venom serine carboxypeptidase-like [Cimex lectularius]